MTNIVQVPPDANPEQVKWFEAGALAAREAMTREDPVRAAEPLCARCGRRGYVVGVHGLYYTLVGHVDTRVKHAFVLAASPADGAGVDSLAALCEREGCTSGCHADDCEHHGPPDIEYAALEGASDGTREGSG